MNIEDDREVTRKMLEEMAAELDLSRKHILVAVDHIRNNEIPRFGAHVLAANGHIVTATNLRDKISQLHAVWSNPSAE